LVPHDNNNRPEIPDVAHNRPLKHSGDLTQWLRQLGILGELGTEVSPVIQPVAVIANASDMSLQSQVTRVLTGITEPALALEHTVFEIQSQSTGGIIVEAITGAAAGDAIVHIGPDRWPLPGAGRTEITVGIYNTGPERQSRAYSGSTTTAPHATQGWNIAGVSSFGAAEIHGLVIPVGNWLTLIRRTVNTNLVVNVRWREVP